MRQWRQPAPSVAGRSERSGPSTAVLVLSELVGRRVVDGAGRPAGQLRDLGVVLDDEHPVVTSARVGLRRGVEARLPWTQVATLTDGELVLGAGAAGIEARAAERPGSAELLLAREVLDVQIVDLAGKRVVRVADVELAWDGHALTLLAVDVGLGALLRRVGLRRLSRRVAADAVDWADLHVASGRGHALALASPASRVHRLRGAELAELVARLPVQRAAEALHVAGPGVAARAVSDTAPHHGARLVSALPATEAGEIVARMPADDAAAALRHLGRPELGRVLEAIPTRRAATLRRLLSHPPDTAGGLMSPEVVTARAGEPVQEIRARVAQSARTAPEGMLTVFVVDEAGRPTGALGPRALLAGEATPRPVAPVSVDAPVEDVVQRFAVEDVLAVPVVDRDGRLAGAVAVDDVLEEVLAERVPPTRRYRLRNASRWLRGVRRHGTS